MNPATRHEQDATHSAWRDESRLAATMGWIAGVIALVVAIAGPAGYYALSIQAQQREAVIAARLHAAFITQVIGQDVDSWRNQVAGLIEAELAPSELPEQRLIRDTQGVVLATSGQDVAAPVLELSNALLSHAGPVGEVLVRRSLRPMLWQTLLVAALSMLLGGAIYLSLRLLPLRALTRTLAALKREERKAREDAEQQLRVVFEHSVEGILFFSPNGVVQSTNPAASELLGYRPEQMVGMPVDRLIAPAQGGTPTAGLANGRSEALAIAGDGTPIPVDLTQYS